VQSAARPECRKPVRAPVSIGLVLASGWVLGQAADSDWPGIVLTATTVAILLVSKVNRRWLLGTAGLLGLAGIG
jgi:chromate transporter